MAITFEYFPANSRASITAVEMKGQKRSLSGNYIPENVLIVGQYDAANTDVVENERKQLFTADEFADWFGYGSEIHRQAIWVFEHLGGFSDKVWGVAVPAPTGTPEAASGDIAFSGTATKAGTFFSSNGGALGALTVAKGATHTETATALTAAITASTRMAVSAAASTGTVTVTAKWSGATGNEIRIVSNPDGAVQEDQNPEGLTVTVPGSGGYLTSGTGDPDVEGVFFADGEDNLGDRWFTIITCPYQDSTALGHYADIADARRDPTVDRFFASYVGYVGDTYSEAYAIPATINNESICPIWDPRSLAPSFEFGAAIAGLVAASATVDPARPFKTLEVGVPMDTSIDDLLFAKNDALFRAGMGYCKSIAGKLVVGDLATSYRTNAAGASTEEWFDAVSIHHRQQKVYSILSLLNSEPYIRAMLGSDDTPTAKDYVVKPKTLVTDLINLVDVWASEGWTKNPEAVKETIVAEINSGNNSRLDSSMTDDPAQALRQVVTKYAFLY